VLGAGYGLAVTVVRSGLSIAIWGMSGWPRVVPSLGFSIGTELVEIGLLALIGCALSPVLRIAAGRFLHFTAMAGLWTALAWSLAFDGLVYAVTAALAPVAGALLAAASYALARRTGGRVVWATGALLLLLGTALPPLVVSVTTPRGVTKSFTPAVGSDLPDILLVVLDTVRAENMSAYGYERPTTPHFDAFARESALFLDATAPATWSLPSHASLFTGRFPSSHGAHYEHPVLGGRWPTLAELLAEAGYETYCFTANVFLNDTLGLTRGFHHKDEAWRSQVGGRSGGIIVRLLDRLGIGASDKGGAEVVAHFADWVETRANDGPPAFVFVNFLEAHFPYHQIPSGFLGRFSTASHWQLRSVSEALMGAQFGGPQPDPERVAGIATDLYDAGVLYTDHLFGQLVEILRAAGSLDETIVVVLSDHGELLGEHGDFGHGASLIEPAIRVPLLVRAPDRSRTSSRVGRAVSTVGVAATVLDLAGVEVPASFQVGSLVPVIEGERGGGPSIAERFAEGGLGPQARTSDPLVARGRRFRTYRSGDLKLFEAARGDGSLFDLAEDPGETTDLSRERPRARKRVEAELRDWRSLLALPDVDGPLLRRPIPELDPGARQRLRALGYIE